MSSSAFSAVIFQRQDTGFTAEGAKDRRGTARRVGRMSDRLHEIQSQHDLVEDSKIVAPSHLCHMSLQCYDCSEEPQTTRTRRTVHNDRPYRDSIYYGNGRAPLFRPVNLW